ncbi:FAD-dependent oxidoreductase [Actinopolymorpha sp. NPDC004070]|uniref:FAD-dependent oxidoreductase n=1 Tax=Actinopolymorpha sp. NPDC004070 TaxID=3154548 RepID=UPI0033AB2654
MTDHTLTYTRDPTVGAGRRSGRGGGPAGIAAAVAAARLGARTRLVDQRGFLGGG